MKIYHYTSIETLALILKNRTLRFSNLESVDDPEEAITKDFGSLEKYFFVSCWTDNSEENIGLWNLYSKDMKGIRIEIDSDRIPFLNSNNQITFPNVIQNINNLSNNEVAILLFIPDDKNCESSLIHIDYTKEEPPNFSYVTEYNHKGLDFKPVVAYKNKCWTFQQEVRFVMMASDTNKKSPSGVLDGILKTKTPIKESYIDLVLSDNFYKDMKIRLGPKCSDAEKYICEALVNSYAKNMNIKIENSNLNIR